ncbi:hypothetical protein ATCC90586_006908 [Pythium insidiosum]|nr:hypothetical protein ATCC90586_006908 [Pythium insidiosum]
MAADQDPAIDSDAAALQVVQASASASAAASTTGGKAPQDEALRRARLRSWYAHMVLVNYAEFAAEAARGLVLPTLFSYSELLGGDLVFMGMLTSMFAAGRFFSSTFFGWLCDRVSFKVLYHICALIAITGNVLYILPYAPGLRSKTLLAVSRFTAGLGGGNRSVCRANIAALTRVDQRLEYFTIFATVVFLAYALTPGVGGVFGDVDVQLGTEYINFNRFTAPGFVLIGLNVLTMVLNAIIYDPAITREDAPRPAPPKEGVKQPDAAAEQKPDEVPISERMVTIGMLVFIFLNITARGILSIFETVNIPLYFMTLAPGTKDVHAALESSEASPSKPGDTNQASAFFFYVGLLGLLSYLSVKMLSKRVSDISFLIFGFLMLLFGNMLSKRVSDISFLIFGFLMLLFGNVILFALSLVYDDTVALPFGWFLVAQILVWSIGCPLTSAVVVSAFSKVLGTRPQGTLMGIFGSSASIARIVLPLLPGILPSWEALFLVNMSLCAASILVLVCVSPSPIVGRRYDALPASVRVARVSGDALQAAFRGCCFNPLTNLLLVCDPVACCVKTFTILPPSHPHGSMRFEFRGKIGDKGNVTGRFMCPCAIDVNTRGEIAVADMKLNRVTMFTGSGQALHHFGKSGTNRGEFRGLVDIKFTVLGYVAAVDSENHRIQVLTVTGGVILTIGVRPGWRLGELCLPCAIDIDRNGDFVVCDAGNGRIQRFNAKGKFLAAWGSLFVCDAALGEVFVFSAVGQCLYKFSLPNKDQWRPIAMCMLRDAWMIVSRQVDVVSSLDPFPTDTPSSHQLLLCAHPQRVPNGRFEPWACVVSWYFAALALSRRAKDQAKIDGEWCHAQDIPFADEAVRKRAVDLIKAAHKGDVSKETFATQYPDADARPEAVDLLWRHVDRVVQIVESVRACVRATLDALIDRYDLMNPSSSSKGFISPATLDALIDRYDLMNPSSSSKGFISPGPVIETWMSDSIVAADVKAKFASEVAVLESVPDDQKDWHPGSDNQVLDLVHPSLYCCVLGETKRVPESESTEPVDADATPADRMHRIVFSSTEATEAASGSSSYQWIPSDFVVDQDGRVKITSYINNLHPVHHRTMYESIEKIFSGFVPLFDRVLTWLAHEEGPKPLLQNAIPYRDKVYYRVPLFPSVPPLLELESECPTKYSIKGTTVQVITKIAEIHLTPEKPAYPGGSWHIEGTETENIVATGIYYFGCENITESKLSFRVIVQPPDYAQSDNLGVATGFGLENDHGLVQSLGAATAIEDRCIVFPNTFQHKVEPFELADPSKPGVRKILAFFIVDPSKKIASTSVIPPQQAEWLQEAQRDVLRGVDRLPEAVAEDTLSKMLGRGMTLDEAKQHRERLMAERGPFSFDDYEEELVFSLCEH